jgi:hypothetical protein
MVSNLIHIPTKSLKLQIGEDADYDKVIARHKAQGLGDSWGEYMKIVPVNFNREHKAMVGHCKMILENEPRKIAINPDKFDKIITALRTAVDNDGVLDKETTSYNDILAAFRLALKLYRFEHSSSEAITILLGSSYSRRLWSFNPGYGGKKHGVLHVSVAIMAVCSISLSFSFLSESTLHHYTTIAEAYAQPYVETVKNRNLTIDIGNGLKTNVSVLWLGISHYF